MEETIKETIAHIVMGEVIILVLFATGQEKVRTNNEGYCLLILGSMQRV